MEQIAFIFGGTYIYRSGLLLTAGAAVAVCVFLALYLRRPGTASAACWAVPMALVLSLVLSRLVHWYCRADSYESISAAMTEPAGGYALMGAFAGCALTAVLLRFLKLTDELPRLLDCMSLAGAAGIAVGRLASFFNTTGRGKPVSASLGLPWVYPMVNPVSGETELRLATFALQALITGAIFIALLVWYLRGSGRREGDATLIFLLCHGAAQVVLDSTRYDSLYLRSNGFVSAVQVLGAGGILLGAAVFSARLVKSRGFRPWMGLWWLAMGLLLGLAGYMEYHVQRHGDQALFAYSVMSLAVATLVGLILLTRHLAADSANRYPGRYRN